MSASTRRRTRLGREHRVCDDRPIDVELRGRDPDGHATDRPTGPAAVAGRPGRRPRCPRSIGRAGSSGSSCWSSLLHLDPRRARVPRGPAVRRPRRHRLPPARSPSCAPAWLTTVMTRIDRLGSGWTVTVVVGRDDHPAAACSGGGATCYVLLGSITVLEVARAASSTTNVLPATPVRRHDHRSVERLLDAVAAGRGALAAFLIGDRVHARRARAGRARSRSGSSRCSSRLFVGVAALPGGRPPVRRGRRRRARGRDPARSRSASSPRTRCSRSPTGGARPRTSTSAAGAAEAIRAGGPGPARGRAVARGRPRRPRRVGRIDPAPAATSRAIRRRYLFGKLYAMSHVRADRWYKLGRTILYGRLEDESSFQSVRRLCRVRGLRGPAVARRRHPDREVVRHRRAHARARVPPRHRVLRRRRGDRRRRGRRRDHRRGR